MSKFSGDALELEIYGSSHAPEIGCRLSGIPARQKISKSALAELMARRAPGGKHATRRKESDTLAYESGFVVDESSEDLLITTGEQIVMSIKNEDTRPSDYERSASIPRPGHADLGEYYRTGTYIETGGGAHSGRMTAPLTAAGGIALQILEQQEVSISTTIHSIGSVVAEEALSEPSEDMITEIETARADSDSVGGQIEIKISGLTAGLGGPLFDGLESHLARLIFAIPAVKAFEIGRGAELASLKASESNDPLRVEGGIINITSDNMGGLLGGISCGHDISARVSFKATPSIAKPQMSVDLETMQNVELEIKGRHDPCVALRARPVLEAATALAILDQQLKRGN